MILAELLAALLTALVLTAVFALVFRRIGPWRGVGWFFLIVLLASWAGGAWMRPVGPAWWGVSWLSFLLIGLAVALLLAAAQPPEEPSPRDPVPEQRDTESMAVAALAVGWFLWLLLIGLVVVVAARYVFVPELPA